MMAEDYLWPLDGRYKCRRTDGGTVESVGRESHLFTVGVDDRLVFEREPFAKWAVSGAELRILACLILLVRRKMFDPIRVPFPWGMIAMSIGIVLIAGGVVWFASLIEWSSLAL